MGDLFCNRKYKCGLRANAFITLWLWCLSIWLPGVSPYCFGSQMEIHPEGLVKVLYGDPLEILCTVSDDQLTADDIEFLEHGISVPSEKVNSTTRRLYKEMPEKGVYTYSCKNKKLNKINCMARVVVDSAPMNVTDFECKSYNLEVLNCTWTSPPAFSVTNSSLSYVINGNRFEPCSKLFREKRSLSCIWTTSSSPRYRQTEPTLHFVVSSSNIFGSNVQHFTIDHYSIVQPSPVGNLKVLAVGTNSVLLQWTVPVNMIDFMSDGLQHEIGYQIRDIDNTSYYRYVNTSNFPTKNYTYEYNLSSLPYAHVEYEVRVRVRPVKAIGEENWSEYISVTFYTGGISIKEINNSIYVNWRRSMKRPLPAFATKTWHMKRQSALYNTMKSGRNGPLLLLPLFVPSEHSPIGYNVDQQSLVNSGHI